jgi:hypothetical protein
MNRQSWLILIVALGLTGGTAAYLGTMKYRQRVGRPGVRVVNVPIYGEETEREGKTKTFLAGTNSVFLPAQVLNFQSKPIPLAKIVCDWLPKDTTYGQRFYTAPDGFSVSTMVVLMGRDRTSIHEPEYCLRGSGWTVTRKETDAIPMPRPVPYTLPVTKLTALREHRNERGEAVPMRGVFVYWFVAENELTADHLKRMWRMAIDMMRTGVLQRWAYVSYFSVCPPGAEEATFVRMKEFIAAATPQFQLVPPASAPATPPGSRAAQK